tara:strand:+ start:304 stop:537 length:234 start_codon:yes stop_codon:yes gene_type:complete
MAASLSCVPSYSSFNLRHPSLWLEQSSSSGIIGILLESTGNYCVFEKSAISSSFERIIDFDVSSKLSPPPAPALILL